MEVTTLGKRRVFVQMIPRGVRACLESSYESGGESKSSVELIVSFPDRMNTCHTLFTATSTECPRLTSFSLYDTVLPIFRYRPLRRSRTT